MSRRVQVYSRKNLSAKASLKYRNERRKRRRQHNKLEDVSVIEAVTLPMHSDPKQAESPQSQNGTPTGGQVRVSYDKYLPCLPQSWECADAEKARIATDMQPIIQTNTVVQPVPYGTKIRTQNHGGKGGPAQGNFSKMRPVGMVEAAPPPTTPSPGPAVTPDAPTIQTSLFQRAKSFLSSLF